jgi:hypothetical protein
MRSRNAIGDTIARGEHSHSLKANVVRPVMSLLRRGQNRGVFVEIPLVNQIRPRVRTWREAGYPGVTGTTKRLFEHWTNPEEFEARRFFFCQLEAAETLIWLTEGPAAEKVGIEVPSDGGEFRRLCAKMATGPVRPS